MPADAESLRTDFEFDVIVADASQVHANPEAGGALEHIDLRTPLRTGFLESREMDFSQLVGNFANFAFDQTETQGAGF